MSSVSGGGLRRSPTIIVSNDQIWEKSAQELILCSLPGFPPAIEMRIIRQFELERDMHVLYGSITIGKTVYSAHLYKGKVNALHISERPTTAHRKKDRT